MANLKANKEGRTYAPGLALLDDMRRLIIDDILQAGGDRTTGYTAISFNEVARRHKVSHNSVASIWKRFCNDYTEKRAHCGGDHSGKLTDEDLELIETLKTEKGSITLSEIYEILEEVKHENIDISLSTISRALKNKMLSGKAYSRKKITRVASQRFTATNMLYTQLFIDYLSSKDPWCLKFFDEAGIKLPEVGTRLYGHAPVGERCVDIAKKCESPNNTLNLLISLNGPEYYNIIPGPSNTAHFLNFFEEAENAVNFETRRPALQVGDIVVMDNLSVHHYDGGEILKERMAEWALSYFILLYIPQTLILLNFASTKLRLFLVTN